MPPLSRQTFGAVFRLLFQCHDFEKFENRFTKPVHTTFRDDTHRRIQYLNCKILHGGDAFAALTKLQWGLYYSVPAIE